ncbi:MAG: immune inhibitor A [Bacteroidota bacterium]|nr:immune inhibitor A [Bacteroidota bacterium]
MFISRLYLLLLSFCLVLSADAQTVLSRVSFPIDAQQTRSTLSKAGLDLSHGQSQRTSFSTIVQDFQFERFDQLGLRYTIDIADMNVYRKEEQDKNRSVIFECQETYQNTAIPKNFDLGTVGGFFSLPEILDQLDAMALLYPDLISIRRPIGNFKTWGNNSIYWVRISDHAETDENEPEILYTGLHHAREFISISQNIYYMWYLLENYQSNPLIKQILDHTELYFIPVINPDGLNYNVEGYDAGEDAFSRAHRKNLRDNDGDGKFDPKYDGVDLNRNYGYEWGHDDEGSSGFEGSDTYRGPSAFSEPETKAIQFFCNTHEFKIAINHHSYGNLLIYPWGYSDHHTQDSTTFTSYSSLLTEQNHFVYGLGEETVGYKTNGDSDDWMFGDLDIYAMTAEVGDSEDWFYPTRDRIIPLCQSTVHLNLQSARLVNSLIDITDETPAYVKPGVNPLTLELNRFGLLDGNVNISFQAVSNNIINVPAPFSINLQKFETDTRELSYTVSDLIQPGDKVKMEIIIQQDTYTYRDTLVKVRADIKTLLNDAGNLANWDRTNGVHWNTTSSTFKSAPVSFTDSPDANYEPNLNEAIVLNEIIDLRDATSAYAQFWARWELEDQYDFVSVQATLDGNNWVNLCGLYSKPGSFFQMYEEPLYDGDQHQWVLEKTDLSDYLGHQLQLRFILVTEGFVNKDGFYFDDFKVITINEETVATHDIDPSSFSVVPNPAADHITVQLPELSKPSLVVFNALGQRVYQAPSITGTLHTITTATWPSGVYQYVIYSGGEPVHSGSVCRIP